MRTWCKANYPARACASKGLCDRSWCPYIIYCLDFFWNQSFISKNTHFEMSILTQIGFSSNLMASGTVQQLDKSSWPSQIPIVCRLGKGSPTPETHIAPNHTPTIADTVPKWLNTPTLHNEICTALPQARKNLWAVSGTWAVLFHLCGFSIAEPRKNCGTVTVAD